MAMRDAAGAVGFLLVYALATVASVVVCILAFGLVVIFSEWFTRLVLGW